MVSPLVTNVFAQSLMTGKQHHLKSLYLHTFISASGKDNKLDYVLIDKSSRRYCTDAEANDIEHDDVWVKKRATVACSTPIRLIRGE